MLQEKITDEEFKLWELFHNPRTLVETLFHDFDSLGSYDENKTGQVRLYQLPLLSTEPLINFEATAKYHNLTDKQAFQLRKNVGTCYAIGSRKWGKCEHEDGFCLLANGMRKQFKDLVGKTKIVVSLNEETRKFEKSEATFFDNGIRDCYKVILSSGKEISITINHPLLTDEGWVECVNLKTGDFIATAKNYKICWDIIKKIEYIGKHKTVGVSVPKHNNYISNDIISHNTCVLLRLDICVSMLHDNNTPVMIFSIDEKRIKGITDYIRRACEYHPFFRQFKIKCQDKDIKYFNPVNGWELVGVNLTLQGKDPGKNMYQLHCRKIYGEEVSQETEETYKKRIDSESEDGAILRLAGMTNTIKHSPCIYEKELVLYPDFTTKPIKDVKIGDIILGWDENKMDLVESEVLNKINNGLKDVIKIKIKDNSLMITPDHEVYLRYSPNKHYNWTPIGKCLLQNFESFLFPQIYNYGDYMKGVLIGLIESDGYIRIKKRQTKGLSKNTYHLYQSDVSELDFIFDILKYFNFKITITKKNKNQYKKYFKRSPNGENYNFYISKDHSLFIDNIFKNLLKNKDIQNGYLAGFILGDGYIQKGGNFTICQKSNTKKDILLQQIIKKLNIPHRRYLERNNVYARYSIQSYNIPFYLKNSKKSKIYQERNKNLFKTKMKNFYPVLFDDFIKRKRVYDLTTTTGNFIANGIIVHNCGRLLTDPENEKYLVRYPQYISPKWDEKEKKKQIKKYGSENDIDYKVYVLGEIIEDGLSEMDMTRVRQCFNDKKKIKHFELNKQEFCNYEHLIVLERPKNCDRIIIAADVGDKSKTEILVFSELGEIYNYLYSITLYGYIQDEQEEVLFYIVNKLKANVLGIDNGDALGRAVSDHAEKKYTVNNVVRYHGNFKVEVEPIQDDNGNLKIEKGKVVFREEYMSEFAVKRIKELFYKKRFNIPYDNELDRQLDTLVGVRNSARTTYKCLCGEDHKFDALKVFTITQWLKRDFNKTPEMQSNDFPSACSWK